MSRNRHVVWTQMLEMKRHFSRTGNTWLFGTNKYLIYATCATRATVLVEFLESDMITKFLMTTHCSFLSEFFQCQNLTEKMIFGWTANCQVILGVIYNCWTVYVYTHLFIYIKCMFTQWMLYVSNTLPNITNSITRLRLYNSSNTHYRVYPSTPA